MISVVMPVRNAEAVVETQLAALAGQTYTSPWELLIVDNGSTDRTLEIVDGYLPRFAAARVITATDRLGASYARNVGAASAMGSFLVFVDSDDRVAPEWLAEMAPHADRCAALGGRLRTFHIDRRGAEQFEPDTMKELPSLDFGFLPYAVGANCGMRADIFEELGGFDERFAVNEEVDLFWRLQLRGYRLCFAHGALVYYRERPTTWAAAKQQFKWGRYLPLLYRDFRSQGLRRTSLRRSLRQVGGALFHTPRAVRSHRARRDWVWRLVTPAGRWVGSFQFRVFFP